MTSLIGNEGIGSGDEYIALGGDEYIALSGDEYIALGGRGEFPITVIPYPLSPYSPYNFAMAIDLLEIEVGELLRQQGLRLAVAESCTGGLVGHRVTNIPGSSDYFLGGIISYANEAKEGLLGVRHETLEKYGAVSEETVREMAHGASQALQAEIGLAISGIAGPGGGTAEKPAGLVWIGLSAPDGEQARRFLFAGDRLAVKSQAAQAALQLLVDYLRGR